MTPRRFGARGGRCDDDLRRDLHDRLGPVLAALTLRVSTIRDHLERDDVTHAAAARDLLAALEDDLSEVVADVREILHAGGEPADGPGRARDLSSFLAARVRLFTQARGENWITLDARGEIDDLPRPVQRALLLVVSEALTNVVRHSGAAECVVELDRGAHELRLRVADDGMHQPPAAPGASGGLGVGSMQARIERLGGSLTVQAGPAGGTEVIARIPVPERRGH